MKAFSGSENGIVLRTDFSDDAAWESLQRATERYGKDLQGTVAYVSDPQYNGFTKEHVRSLFAAASPWTFIFVADQIAISRPQHPILVINLIDEEDLSERGRTFRVTPATLWEVAANLSIANMDFFEFADAADDTSDGIFHGFS